MKNYVQYHNAFVQGPVPLRSDGRFQIFAKKSIKHLLDHRVWLISGHGKTSPKHFQLEYVFGVEEIVKDGAKNLAIGSTGHRFTPAPALNYLPWFNDFLGAQQHFRNGLSQIADEHLAELRRLVPTTGGPHSAH